MRNVVVFSLAGARYAIELRWVREVFTLGPVTPVPTAPPAIAGVVNHRGGILPVLDLGQLLAVAGATGAAPGGDRALLTQVEATRAALRIDAVDEVSSLQPGELPASVIDSQGRSLQLIYPPDLLVAVQPDQAEEPASLGDQPLDDPGGPYGG